MRNSPCLRNCNSCPECEGFEIIQNITAYKSTGQILSIDEVVVYKCGIFEYITEDTQCYDVDLFKKATVNRTEWTKH